jgi:cyclophilin family peptidyl-prolyl cis-trans isomerase
VSIEIGSFISLCLLVILGEISEKKKKQKRSLLSIEHAKQSYVNHSVFFLQTKDNEKVDKMLVGLRGAKDTEI